jgi:hypothetical protein
VLCSFVAFIAHQLTHAAASIAQALHAVGCASGGAGACGGVTLHLYAPPIRRAKLYEAAENRVTLRHPGFFSAAGAVIGGGDAVPGRAPALRQ